MCWTKKELHRAWERNNNLKTNPMTTGNELHVDLN